jgi:hypothetical protein
LETSINIVEKISVFLNKVDPSIHPTNVGWIFVVHSNFKKMGLPIPDKD